MKRRILDFLYGPACKHGHREHCMFCWFETKFDPARAEELLDTGIALLMGARLLIHSLAETSFESARPTPATSKTVDRTRPACDHTNPGN